MKLRVLIADDEPLSRQRLKQFLCVEPCAELVAECGTGTDAVRVIRDESPDLVFLDVKMPGLDGFRVMESLEGVRLPAIVFVTAYNHFAVQAFAADAVDYLVKPFDQERFQTAFQRARARLQRGACDPPALLLINQPTGGGPPVNPIERLIVKSGGRITLLKVAEIDWIGAADNYVELHVGGVTHLLRMTLAAVADQLPDQFMRISRSRLVNVSRIKEVHPKAHGDFLILLRDGTRLAGTRNHRGGLRSLLGKSR